ncbi:MAG: aminotransferase class V-fold PLP-dependent enzyme [Thermoanaerobaculales bacterium]|jgi:L-2,4-diaminobutyrate decarboxylase|nr:aminotransferase class V-fold PLP-dependent enzyme [Thermoanaerobaculales bacterium]
MNDNQLKGAFDPVAFREEAHAAVDLLADYLERAADADRRRVLPAIPPDEMARRWSETIPSKPNCDLVTLLTRVIEDSHHLHSPHYVGHQVSAPLPVSAVADFVGSLLNNASAVYDMGPVNVIHERRIVEWMCGLLGYGPESGGILTSGGTLGNLTALLAARQVMTDADVWSEGAAAAGELAVMVSEQCHYSVRRAVGVMGLGTDNVIEVPTGPDFKMNTAALAGCLEAAEIRGKRVFAVAANACSTATGTYDDLAAIADFCDEQGLWFHVDGAHGASASLSPRHRHLLAGVHRADSVVWDAHKMLLVPALITAVIFKNGGDSYRSFSQKASYLFEKASEDEWYNYAHRTMECTKTMMGLKLYVPLMVLGSELFAHYVETMYDLARDFAARIRSSADFELAVEPEANIVCFRFVGHRTADVDVVQKEIRTRILEREDFYLVRTDLRGDTYLRCTIINPLTTIANLEELLDLIRTVGSEVAASV